MQEVQGVGTLTLRPLLCPQGLRPAVMFVRGLGPFIFSVLPLLLATPRGSAMTPARQAPHPGFSLLHLPPCTAATGLSGPSPTLLLGWVVSAPATPPWSLAKACWGRRSIHRAPTPSPPSPAQHCMAPAIRVKGCLRGLCVKDMELLPCGCHSRGPSVLVWICRGQVT